MTESSLSGPFDSGNIDQVRPYIDFGSLRIEPRADMSVSVEIDESSGRIVAITIDQNDSKLQVMAFAAPRNEGIWSDIRASIATNVEAQGGVADETFGPLGVQLDAKLPLVDDQGRPSGYRLARFVGFDGPRWCLRGTIGGLALSDIKAEADLIDIFRSIVVHRGDAPLPPSEALELRLPEGSVVPPGLKTT